MSGQSVSEHPQTVTRIQTHPAPADFPDPVYGCLHEVCREAVTWPAEDLWWHRGCDERLPGFYCRLCWDNDDALISQESGISLAEAKEEE